ALQCGGVRHEFLLDNPALCAHCRHDGREVRHSEKDHRLETSEWLSLQQGLFCGSCEPVYVADRHHAALFISRSKFDLALARRQGSSSKCARSRAIIRQPPSANALSSGSSSIGDRAPTSPSSSRAKGSRVASTSFVARRSRSIAGISPPTA